VFTVLSVLAILALVIQGGILLLALFGPVLPYTVPDTDGLENDSEQFRKTLAALTSGALHTRNKVEILANGEVFYEAELAAIRAARTYIQIECYIFQEGRLTDRFVEALTERARAGVKVYMVIDAIGSAAYPKSKFEELKKAGGRVAWYHPLRWYSWPRINNRTHREILIVDGEVGFTGGAGFADQWIYGIGKSRRWRDMMARIEGEAVSGLEATFAENWLESAGEVLMRPELFPFRKADGNVPVVVVNSSPTSGRSTQARVLFQALLATARSRIYLTTPYFLPDTSLTAELVRAKERDVDVRILVPGTKTDHLLTRSSSRRLYGDLLKVGIEIHEYHPAMLHAKCLVVDGKWSVVGTTNMDPRSFGLNDEVSVAMFDEGIAKRLEQDFAHDLSESRRVTYEDWKKRPATEKSVEFLGGLIQRMQ
jgi:cardiolipin synthase